MFTIPIIGGWFYDIMNTSFNIAIILFGGLFTGLVIYAYDYPKKQHAEREYNQLSEHIINIICPDAYTDIVKTRPTYFYIQYNIVDTTSQGVIQYFRSVYRVYTNLIGFSKGMMLLIHATLMLNIILSFLIGTIDITSKYILYESLLLILIVGFFIILKNNNKGEEYLENSIEYQKNYFDLEKDKIKRAICRNPEPGV